MIFVPTTLDKKQSLPSKSPIASRAGKFPVALVAVSIACVFFMVTTIFLWSRNSELERQLAAKKAQFIAELEKGIAQDERAMNAIDRADAVNAVCGIYEFEDRMKGILAQQLELRSDGTALSKPNTFSTAKKSTWTLNAGSVTTGYDKFKVEGYDLIDSKGNRWLRVR